MTNYRQYTPDGAWVYNPSRGWQPVPGTQPKTPCPDVKIRHTPTITPIRRTA